MTAISVGDVFEDEGAMAGPGVFFAVLNSSFDCKDVHAIDLQPWDVLTTLIVFSEGRSAIGSRAHSIFVV